MSRRYKKSEDLLARALETIPLGTQTFSKSKTQLPYGVSPYFATRANGSKLYDVDGNEYVDFVNSLAAITLGYGDQDVNNAVREQLEKGTIFSLANELEIEVSERICKMVPCAEMVRFGKNGSDATSGAIRLARAFTGKQHVLVCGYHGWQDWYIGSTSMSLGVPDSTKALTHQFKYNDPDSLEKLFEIHKGDVAAVILEPVNIEKPENDFLEKVKELAHLNDSVLIFDETITGFRFSKGGAQEFFNVIPDLACFGKGLANGYPLSAIAGKKEIMILMEEIFFSFTFGGELLSLAAANATLNKLEEHSVIEQITKTGTEIVNRINLLIEDYKLGHIFEIKGYPVWSFLVIKDSDWANSLQLKTLFLQEMFKYGIFTLGTHNISYSHTKEDIDKLESAYQKFFQMIIDSQNQPINSLLKCNVIKPLFKVR